MVGSATFGKPGPAMRPRSAIALTVAALLVLGQGGGASAQDTEAAGDAVSQDGSVVEGGPGGLDIGQGTLWLGVAAALAVGLGLAIAADDSDSSAATGTNGTSGTSGTSGTN